MRRENEDLIVEAQTTTERNVELTRRLEESRHKYKSKKTECNLLREKCIKFNAEIASLTSQLEHAADFMDVHKRQTQAVE